MKKYFDVLRKCPLFRGIKDDDILTMLGCLGGKEREYHKGDIILAEGEPAKYLGIVLSGNVQIERVDFFGNRSILASIKPSQIFGESFNCAGIEQMPVDVIATEATTALLIDVKRITSSCNNACAFHSLLVLNLLNIMAKKNLGLHQKIEITSKRSTREKLMTFLLLQAKDFGSNDFDIAFDRQELADYLEVERSGLSAEISKMRSENILLCKKNHFTLL